MDKQSMLETINVETLNYKNSFTEKDFLEVLKRASTNVNSNLDYLNKINVFPVADGDTGSNMGYTLKSVVRSLENENINDFTELARLTTKSFLINSRGNSGTILAQFFKGFCSNFEGLTELNLKSLKESFQRGNEEGIKSFIKPQKGTILDIFEKSTEVFNSFDNNTSLIFVFEKCIKQSEIALENTKKTMFELRKVQIIDSGAAGFVLVLKSFLEVLKDQKGTENNLKIEGNYTKVDFNIPIEKNLEYQFCTECILVQRGNFQVKIQEIISNLGDSIQIIESDNFLKIHIHTNQPQKVSFSLEQFGSIENFKADDMLKMNADSINKNHSKSLEKNKLTIITDTSCDIPKEWLDQYSILFAEIPVFLPTGDQENLSKKYSISQFYEVMEMDEGFNPMTSKANPQTYIDLINEAQRKSENILILPISSQMSGSFDSAYLAKQEFKNQSNVLLVDSKTSGPGLAILIKEAFEFADKNENLDLLPEYLETKIQEIQIYFVVDNVKYLERSGRLSKTSSIIGQLLGLQPIITVNKDGKIVSDKQKILFSNPQKKVNSLLNKIKNFQAKNKIKDLFIVYCGKTSLTQVNILKEKAVKDLKIDENKIFILENNSVIGSKVGPGTIGVIFT